MRRRSVIRVSGRRDSYHTRTKSWWDTITDIRKRAKGKCEVCGNPGSETHHIIPLNRGGTNASVNLMLLCKPCHDNRHTHLKRGRRR